MGTRDNSNCEIYCRHINSFKELISKKDKLLVERNNTIIEKNHLLIEKNNLLEELMNENQSYRAIIDSINEDKERVE